MGQRRHHLQELRAWELRVQLQRMRFPLPQVRQKLELKLLR